MIIPLSPGEPDALCRQRPGSASMARQAAGDGGAFEVATFVQFATNDDGSVDIRALDRFSA
jgi:hypothetical protein